MDKTILRLTKPSRNTKQSDIMKWLEIIELRTGGRDDQDLQKALTNLLVEIKQDVSMPKVRIYNNYSVDSDFSIHLVHKHDKPDAMGSVLGMHIAASLKNYGLMNHHVWCEMNVQSKKEETLDKIH